MVEARLESSGTPKVLVRASLWLSLLDSLFVTLRGYRTQQYLSSLIERTWIISCSEPSVLRENSFARTQRKLRTRMT